ncbi:eukaryotic translation initiation factor 4 gamma 3-like isoform X5 [Polistes fuscatus]|uniref:eukaryotic translation initiation factor 4 gamma 3-like isoform X5 n=1 Tax=Polistes fuscatus TaxID=30207 RepID=UPI001CA9423E|nr:eukaryotic translation initiation factor 4 gamma 3-like isoform X5 [Polistes fuscatus]
MVSRFGVSKEGGVDVASVGTMQCIIGPHHHHHYPAPHPQNPQPGHHVHHATHPPPPSPSPHLNHQLSHHQIAVNINQIGQQLGHQAPPLRVFTQNRSEFHVPTANYGAQPGGQVGGGGGSVGVPGGRGPPLGGLPLGQSTAGIPPGGPAGGQAPPQAQAPGVQAQQTQGPAPTTTPPVHTPSPQEMGKPTHMQTHNYYSAAPRPQQPRNLNHRGGQGGTNNQVVGMAGVAGGAGQPPVMYTAGLTSQPGAVFVPSHVAGIPTGPHQQSVYHMNNQLIQFSSAPQRHQTQGQSYYPPYQPHALLTQNLYPYQAGPAPTPSFFYASPTAPLGINRSSATAVSGGAQHVGSALGGAQGAAMVPQGTLQQTTQQPQPLPQIVPGYYKDYNLYSGYNGGATTGTNSSIRSKKPRGEKAITDIVNPSTGKNISHEIYNDDTSIEHESNSRETPQLQPMTTTTLASTTLVDQEVKRTTSPPSVNVQAAAAPQHQQHQPQQQPQQPQQSQHHHHQQQHHHLHQQQQQNYQQQSVHPAQQQHAVPNVATIPEVSKPSSNAASVNPAHIRDNFSSNPTTAPKTSSSPPNKSNSPPRRKSQSHNQTNNANSEPLAINAKELREKKREKSINSRGVTPAPAHNQPDHHHHHHQKTNGDANGDKSEQEAIVPPPIARNEVPSKPTEGKVIQKQKNKNKLKPRDLNRKGAEKEGTDMDAFMNKLDNKITATNKETFVTKENKDFQNIEEIVKDNKDTDNKESSTEKETTNAVYCKTSKNPIKDVVDQESNNEQQQQQQPVVQATNIEKSQDDKEVCNKEVSSNVEDNSQIVVTSPVTCSSNAQIKSVPNNDVVDHAIVKDNIDVETIVAQKNEENTKMSTLQQQQQQQQQQASSNEEKVVPSVPTVEKSNESSEQSQQQPQQQQTQQSSQSPTVDVSKNSITLKYTYKDDQWSPINKDGKKVYDREFLIRLQDDPNSKIKPTNLPDLEVVLKDNKSRTPMDFRSFKDTSMSRPESLFPVFVKSSGLTRNVAPTNRKSLPPGKPKTNNQKNMIHLSLSLREDVKLRETENAWKPARLKQLDVNEEEAKTLQLYKRVRSVLNKLTPQKFSTLVEQVRALNIDTQERLQGVINLVFEKAVDEPSFSVAYALMCKELAMIEASGNDKSGAKQTESSVNFRKLIISRCQKEFEKNPIDEVTRTNKLKEIDECTDPEKKKDLLLQLEEEERRIRIKSVGNIRFIGELYKQGMLTTSIMHRCIIHLLDQNDEDSLECLCKLLTTIGKDLESKSKYEEMQEYFCKMSEIVCRRGQSKISSRIRFMLQDVIDLRANKWVPRRDDSNPKTIDQIQKEVESERLDTQLTNTPLNTPRKDDRNADRKRNRGFGAADEGGWSQPVGRARQTYSVETAKLRQKTTPVDDLILGSRNNYMWKTSTNNTKNSTNKFALLDNINTIEQDRRMPPLPLSGSRSTGPRDYGRDYKSSYDGRSSRNGSHQLSSGASSSRESSLLDNAQSQSVSMPTQSLKSPSSQPVTSNLKPPLSEEEFTKVFNSILKDYLREHSLENAISDVIQTFDNTTFTKFVRESINYVLERSPPERERVSRLMSELIKKNAMPLQHLKDGFSEVVEFVDDLIIDIPKIWTYLAEVLTHPLKEEIMPLSEMSSIFKSLKIQGCAGKLLGELLAKLSQEKGSKWVADKWDQSRLSLNDIIDSERESIDKIAKEYHLEFLIGDYNSAKSSNNDELSLQQIHEHLRKLMKEKSFDQISNWITEFVNNRVKDPKFIRILMTAILETSIEPLNENIWKLNENTFSNLELLIHRYVDTDEVLELQCLYAIQAYMTKIEFPLGILRSVINKLSGDNIISSDAFLAWQKGEDPAEHEGHSVAIMTLTAFFTSLQEAEDSSSVEDGPSNVNSDHF